MCQVCLKDKEINYTNEGSPALLGLCRTDVLMAESVQCVSVQCVSDLSVTHLRLRKNREVYMSVV